MPLRIGPPDLHFHSSDLIIKKGDEFIRQGTRFPVKCKYDLHFEVIFCFYTPILTGLVTLISYFFGSLDGFGEKFSKITRGYKTCSRNKKFSRNAFIHQKKSRDSVVVRTWPFSFTVNLKPTKNASFSVNKCITRKRFISTASFVTPCNLPFFHKKSQRLVVINILHNDFEASTKDQIDINIQQFYAYFNRIYIRHFYA